MAAQGWCPSTHRIFPAPDGGLARVKVPGGRLTIAQLRAVAEAARRCGNGVIDLTTRANLQVRGVDPEAAPALRALLAPVGLSAPSAAVEDRRNVMASPAAGLDPHEVLDVRPLVTSIVAALDALPEDLPLPHKVGVLLDGGGSPSLRGIAVDVALGAVRDADGAVRLEVALGGSLDDADLSTIDPADAPALVAAAAGLCAGPPDGELPSRMAAVVAAAGPAVVDLLTPVVPTLVPSAPRRIPRIGGLAPVPASDGSAPSSAGHEDVSVLGAHPTRAGGGWLGVRAADEPVTAEHLDALADVVEASGATEVRLTPWRSVVVADPVDVERAEVASAAAGWTTAPAPGPVALRRTAGAVA